MLHDPAGSLHGDSSLISYNKCSCCHYFAGGTSYSPRGSKSGSGKAAAARNIDKGGATQGPTGVRPRTSGAKGSAKQHSLVEALDQHRGTAITGERSKEQGSQDISERSPAARAMRFLTSSDNGTARFSTLLHRDTRNNPGIYVASAHDGSVTQFAYSGKTSRGDYTTRHYDPTETAITAPSFGQTLVNA